MKTASHVTYLHVTYLVHSVLTILSSLVVKCVNALVQDLKSFIGALKIFGALKSTKNLLCILPHKCVNHGHFDSYLFKKIIMLQRDYKFQYQCTVQNSNTSQFRFPIAITTKKNR